MIKLEIEVTSDNEFLQGRLLRAVSEAVEEAVLDAMAIEDLPYAPPILIKTQTSKAGT